LCGTVTWVPLAETSFNSMYVFADKVYIDNVIM